ncbi:MAG: transketolase [Anaerolineae bacterium]|nr:transketolase [Anaerolineae bacterium]
MTDRTQLAINTMRFLAVDAVQKANSGHPGLPMGAAPMAYVLWTRYLRHSPKNPQWPNRDRFVLSGGHGSMLLYALLYLTGYDSVSMADIQNFRQYGSPTPGHPESHLTAGVEATTGPLGQGFGNGVGMAIAERFLAATFNRPGHTIVDHYTYALVSDGDIMEGVSAEAASLAGHLKLGKLIYLYDDNQITLADPAKTTFSEDVTKRFEAYGWHVERVADGNGDLEGIARAIARARAETERPSLIRVQTTIGYGSPNKANTPDAHGSPLGPEEVKLTKQALGWPLEPDFYVPDEALVHFRQAIDRGTAAESAWQAAFAAYAAEYPDLATLWEQFQSGALPDGWDADLPAYKPEDGPVATRKASGAVLNAIAPKVKNLIGGDADLAPSTNTLLKGSDEQQAGTPGGRNLRFGVREHAMGAIVNGIAYHGGLIPYGSTFLVFSDYMRGALRLSALAHLKALWIFTHDSVWVGEDGPTHEPVEHVASLRAMPNMTVIRPADANEVVAAYRVAMQHRGGPVSLILSRQNLPVFDRAQLGPAAGVQKGAYVLYDPAGAPDIILIATGSEVSLAMQAKDRLEAQGVSARVVSMPSWELFDQQPADYCDSVLPPSIKARLAVEAGVSMGWHKYVGDAGRVFSRDDFGASAPYKALMQAFGFTPEHVAEAALEVIAAAKARA